MTDPLHVYEELIADPSITSNAWAQWDDWGSDPLSPRDVVSTSLAVHFNVDASTLDLSKVTDDHLSQIVGTVGDGSWGSWVREDVCGIRIVRPNRGYDVDPETHRLIIPEGEHFELKVWHWFVPRTLLQELAELCALLPCSPPSH